MAARTEEGYLKGILFCVCLSLSSLLCGLVAAGNRMEDLQDLHLDLVLLTLIAIEIVRCCLL